MTGKIQLTPAELKAQAAEMSALSAEYEMLFSGVSSSLKNVNSNWSANLSRNFEGKITSAQNAFKGMTDKLTQGAIIATTSANTFESVDSLLAKNYVGSAAEKSYTVSQMEEKPKLIDMDNYISKVSDAEYAKLCALAYDAVRSDDPQKKFIDLLNDGLPDNDPLSSISSDQVSVIEVDNGFSSIIISDGDTAVVVFVGTNSKRDWFDNVLLGIAQPTPQSQQAIAMIESLSKTHSNIVVTGHSLGGYLATSATLKNSTVSRCVAFDPPGRSDNFYQRLTNSEQFNKVTTYEAKGSLVSKVAVGVGDVKKISVKENGGALDHNHDIKEIWKSEDLGGDERIERSWE